MKKVAALIFFIFLFSLSFVFKVKGNIDIVDSLEPIIGEEDTIVFSDLDMEGYTYSTSASFEKKGMYDIFYKGEKDFRRDMLILDKNEMMKGFSYTVLNSIIYTKGGSIKNAFKGEYFSYINEEKDNKICSYIMYKDDKGEYEEKIEDVNIVDLVDISGKAYILYEYKKDMKTKIGVMIVDKYLSIIRDMKYGTNGIERAKKILYVNGKIFIAFDSNSNENVLLRASSFNTIVLMEINKVSLLKEKAVLIGNNNDSYLEDVYLKDDIIYIYGYFTFDGGDFYNTLNKSYTGHMLVCYDLKNVYTLASISSDYDAYDFKMTDNGYFLIGKIENGGIDINYFNIYDPYKAYTVRVNIKENISDIVYTSFNESLIVVCNEDDLIKEIKEVRDNEIYDYAYPNFSYKAVKILASSDDIYLYSYPSNVYVYKLFLYKGKKEDKVKTINNVKINYEEISFFRNDKIIELNKIREEEMEAGVKNVKIVSENDEVKFVYKALYKVPLVCNLSNNTEYDLMTILEFNGRGLLNGYDIESGYVLEKKGNYCLEMRDANNEKIVINFKVSDLCAKAMDVKKKEKGEDAKYIKYEESRSYFKASTCESESYDERYELKVGLIFILFIFFVLYFFINYKVKRRNKI